MIWEQLIKIALLGTERSTLNPPLKKVLAKKGINVEQENTLIVLYALAYFSTIQKAGWKAQNWKGKTTQASKAGHLQPCSPKSAQHLQTVFKTYLKLLPEFLAHLKKSNKTIPYEALPFLLDQCIKNEILWRQVHPVMGERGKWLLPLNPAWKLLDSNIPESLWQTGTRLERLAILKQTRQKNASKGLALLQSTWASDSHSEKVVLLEALSINLSLNDEAFLASCLTASRKEIRLAAADLLYQLPDSQLQERLQKSLRRWINVDKKNNQLSITLDTLDVKTLLTDNIPIDIKRNQATDKWYLLAKIIQVVPPSFWQKLLLISPQKIITLFSKQTSSLLLTNALIKATAFHEAEEWMLPLLEMWLDNYYKKDWEELSIDLLLKKIPNDLFNQIVEKKLTAVKTFPDAESPIIKLLFLEGQAWSHSLTFLFLDRLRDWIIDNATYSWLGLPYRKLLKERAAYAIAPSLHPKVTAFWHLEQNSWAGWEQDIQYFLNVLSFRKEIADELMFG